MTIDEAIELLECAKEGFPANDTEKYYVAMGLGIEALKLIEVTRRTTGCESFGKLPGETKD